MNVDAADVQSSPLGGSRSADAVESQLLGHHIRQRGLFISLRLAALYLFMSAHSNGQAIIFCTCG